MLKNAGEDRSPRSRFHVGLSLRRSPETNAGGDRSPRPLGASIFSTLERLRIFFHDQNRFLLEFAHQFPLEFTKKPAGGTDLRGQDAKNDHVIAKHHAAHLPLALVRLGKERTT